MPKNYVTPAKIFDILAKNPDLYHESLAFWIFSGVTFIELFSLTISGKWF